MLINNKNIANIPNTLTSLNLIVGILTIFFAIASKIDLFLYGFVVCIVLDGLDGWYARSFNCVTNFGKKFDAFADVFSFGFILTFLIGFRIFQDPPFWQIVLAGWITLANIIRYFKLVANKEDKVYGVPNLVVSLFIIALYMQKTFIISQNSWSYIIAILSLLMLIPVEFINHKSLKNELTPNKRSNLLFLLIPIVVIPLFNLSFFWLLVVCITGCYISYILISLPPLLKKITRGNKLLKNSHFQRKVLPLEYQTYTAITLTIILLRVVQYKV